LRFLRLFKVNRKVAVQLIVTKEGIIKDYRPISDF
jgi:hypothetical protein